MGASEETETVYLLLERLSANPDRGVLKRVGKSPFAAVYAKG